MNPLVSILIPVYNAEQWLSDTLKSAMAQTWPHKEIIVVDDGSTDGSLKIGRMFESNIVKVFSLPHNGQAIARNRGLLEAQGQYIQYLDADDLIAPDKIERQIVRLLDEPGRASSTCRWTRIFGAQPADAAFELHDDFRDYDFPVEWLLQAWGGRGTMPPVAWLLSRVVVDQSGPWNETLSLCDDTEYFTRVILNSSKIAYCPDAYGYYRSGNATQSSRRDRKSLESFFVVCRLCAGHLISFEDSPRSRRACANLWQFFAYWTYPEAPDLVRAAEQNVREYGGADLRMKVSPALEVLSTVVGWKGAKRVQRAYYSLRYS